MTSNTPSLQHSNSPLPNLVYIFADDMGYGDLSCLNENSKIKTKHLDKMAANGMRFHDAHSSSSVCTPSRYSVLTGRYNWRSRIKQGVMGGYSQHLIEDDRMTVPSLLKSKGYDTACFGKWHLGMDWPLKGGGFAEGYNDADEVDFSQPIQHGPTTNGFDTFFGISASLDMQPYVYIQDNCATTVPTEKTPGSGGKKMWREGWIGSDFKHEEVLPTLTQKVVDYIDDPVRKNTPFFLHFPLPAPHTPILPLPKFQGKSGTNEYGDFCLQVDDTVGQVMAALDRNGLTDNTILVFTTDNGCSPAADFDELAAVGHHPSYHFRGHKADIWEGGHRIPLLIQWPNGIKAGSTTDQTVCLTDLMATVAEIVGKALPDNAGEDSVSNLAIWNGTDDGTPLREATVHHSISGMFSIRKGKWKLEMCPGSGGWSDPRDGAAAEQGLPAIQLYDLDADSLCPYTKLLHRRSSKGITSRNDNLPVVSAENVGKLGNTGGFSRSIHSRY